MTDQRFLKLYIGAALTYFEGLRGDTIFRVYYDPTSWLFHICPNHVVEFDRPDSAVLLCVGNSTAVFTVINQIIARAVRNNLTP